jgi:nitric oxide reductase NorE protein
VKTAVDPVLEELEPATPPARRLPGAEGFWAFALADLAFFGLLLGSYVHARARHPQSFDRAQDALVVGLGYTNMVVLLTSSWFVAVAVRCVRTGDIGIARKLLLTGAFCGAVFAALKVLEYGLDLGAGAGSTGGGFFTYYAVLTGLHFVHVLVGVTVLWTLARRMTAPVDPSRLVVRVETGTIFWHLVDLLWVIIFATLYLAR